MYPGPSAIRTTPQTQYMRKPDAMGAPSLSGPHRHGLGSHHHEVAPHAHSVDFFGNISAATLYTGQPYGPGQGYTKFGGRHGHMNGNQTYKRGGRVGGKRVAGPKHLKR